MKYEIEIEGLPEGYEPTAAKVVNTATENCVAVIALRRKVRKYDWSKTLGDVLVTNSNFTYAKRSTLEIDDNIKPGSIVIASVWQPNLDGKCPVDPDASIVRVKTSDGNELEDLAANIKTWHAQNFSVQIVAWQFVRLADGYEW